MSKNELKEQIITDLKRDYPNIKEIKSDENNIIILADDDTLWEVFEVLYNGLDDVELNMGQDEDAHIIIKI